MRQDRTKVCKRLEMLIVKIDYRKDLSSDVKQNVLNAMRKVLWKAQTLNDEKFSINFRDSQINSPHQTPYKVSVPYCGVKHQSFRISGSDLTIRPILVKANYSKDY